MPGRPPSRQAMAGAVAIFLLASPTLAACSDDEGDYETQDTYILCVNKDTGEIVDPALCPQVQDGEDDDDGYSGVYWFHSSPTYYPPGSSYRAPPGTKYINPKSSKARSAAGLPGKGKIGGSSVKTGVTGKGGSGSGS